VPDSGGALSCNNKIAQPLNNPVVPAKAGTHSS
jgi:hypothetical protein